MLSILSNRLLFGQGWTDDGTVVRLTTSTDNVGIGTAAPYTKLTLAGPLGFTNGSTPMSYIYQSGIGNAERFVLAHSPAFPTHGLAYNDIEDQMIFKGNGTPVMTIDVGGANFANVGIGASPSSADRLKILGNSAGSALRVEQSGSGSGILAYVNTTSSAQTIFQATSNVSGLSVLGNGQTLIGLATSSPSYDLQTRFIVENVGGNGQNTNGGKFVSSSNFNSTAAVTGLATGTGDVFWTVGVIGQAVGTTGTHGVWGTAEGPAENYSVYANQGYNGIVNYAGYFAGIVYATNYLSPSDEKLKRNIQPMTGALEKIILLNSKTYEYDTERYKVMGLPQGARHGFVAQEFAQVFPELTKKAVQPMDTPEERRAGKTRPESLEFTAVDYVSLIPVLTAAIQEQQGIIEQLVAALEQNGIEVNVTLPGKKANGKSTPTPIKKSAPGAETPALEKSVGDEIPQNFDLSNNYPNPFNPSTTIEYALPAAGQVTIKVYNSLGQEVRTLVDDFQQAGYKSVVWDGKNHGGSPVASGTYIYRVTSGKFVKSEKMVLTK